MFVFDQHNILENHSKFGQAVKYFDRQRNVFATKIKPGQAYVTQGDDIIVTALGSCIAVCVMDKEKGIAGMNHFMVPAILSDDLSENSKAMRYGCHAMELLMNRVMAFEGNRRALEIKLFGGAEVVERLAKISRVNIDFIRQYVKQDGLNVISEDLGGVHPRKLIFEPATGLVHVKPLRSLHNETILKREDYYLDDIMQWNISNSVKLFF